MPVLQRRERDVGDDRAEVAQYHYGIVDALLRGGGDLVVDLVKMPDPPDFQPLRSALGPPPPARRSPVTWVQSPVVSSGDSGRWRLNGSCSARVQVTGAFSRMTATQYARE